MQDLLAPGEKLEILALFHHQLGGVDFVQDLATLYAFPDGMHMELSNPAGEFAGDTDLRALVRNDRTVAAHLLRNLLAFYRDHPYPQV